jgi:hypothetical protein
MDHYDEGAMIMSEGKHSRPPDVPGSASHTRWYRGLHSDDPLTDLPTLIMDNEPAPAERHRAKIIVSGVLMAVCAGVMAWAFVSITSAPGQASRADASEPSASPSHSARLVPVTVLPSFAQPVPSPAARQKPLSASQSQDLNGPAPVVRATPDHVRSTYPGLARRFLTSEPPDKPAAHHFNCGNRRDRDEYADWAARHCQPVPPTTPPTTEPVAPPTTQTVVPVPADTATSTTHTPGILSSP